LRALLRRHGLRQLQGKNQGQPEHGQ
jgi:hypothetical protein